VFAVSQEQFGEMLAEGQSFGKFELRAAKRLERWMEIGVRFQFGFETNKADLGILCARK
jgi:hypothetical protein